MAVTTITTNICEFDLDGTLVYSIDAIVESWKSLSKQYPEFVVDDDFLHKTHGVRVFDIIKRYLPKSTKDLTEDEILELSEQFQIDICEKFGGLAKPVTGSLQFLDSIPQDKWCIVTSGSYNLAIRWFSKVLKIEKPKVFITADDIPNGEGKPNPYPYLLGARNTYKLLESKGELTDDVHEKRVVFEDAPAGIEAGLKSGAIVIGIASNYDSDYLYKYGANYVIKDYSSIKVVKHENDLIHLEINYL
ncbi:unnamed protein product [[Candida] boidinii]|uniref:Unnamed protein product n=1 Tax=Candida boidinii TaxID=5477 RepID=A0A9W6SUL1_CANBO|nr:hypothetical protein B5S30_g2374 [[Candida] boidinii]GME67006.1 unnamed protein product [[Candida] boidinii]GMF01960.1 unnamed protein product [[Candida] boidinii]